MQNKKGGPLCVHSAFCIHHSAFPSVPVVERRPRERAKLEVQVRFLAGAMRGPTPECRVLSGDVVTQDSALGTALGLVSVRVSTAPCHGVRTGSSPVRGAGRIFELIRP